MAESTDRENETEEKKKKKSVVVTVYWLQKLIF